jgi:Flp pilus assembly protein TadG
MRTFKKIKTEKGQALTEMVIALPALCLFAAGIIQFAILFLSYVQFEHACGEAARQYAAGMINKDSIEIKIEDNLGHFRNFFDLYSLTATIQPPQSTPDSVLNDFRNIVSKIPFGLTYDGYEWSVDINCRPPFFFALIFPGGIPFHTVMQVYRYPG